MDAQGLGRTHPLTPTRRLKQHTHAYNPARPGGAAKKGRGPAPPVRGLLLGSGARSLNRGFPERLGRSTGSLIPSCRGRSNEHHHTGPRALKSPQKPFSGLKMVTDRLRDDHGPAPEKSQSSL